MNRSMAPRFAARKRSPNDGGIKPQVLPPRPTAISGRGQISFFSFGGDLPRFLSVFLAYVCATSRWHIDAGRIRYSPVRKIFGLCASSRNMGQNNADFHKCRFCQRTSLAETNSK